MLRMHREIKGESFWGCLPFKQLCRRNGTGRNAEIPWIRNASSTDNFVVSILLKRFTFERTAWCLMRMWWRRYEWTSQFFVSSIIWEEYLPLFFSSECVPRPAGGGSVRHGKLLAWQCECNQQGDYGPFPQRLSFPFSTLSWKDSCLQFCLQFILPVEHCLMYLHSKNDSVVSL